MHRLATVNDLFRIQEIERAAGQTFRTVGMESVAEDEPISAAVFESFLNEGEAWVTVSDDRFVIAYLLVEPLDGAMHVEQVTVHPSVARRGIGARLLDVANERATERKLDALTLTTFRDVPWNAPYYTRLGFGVIASERWGRGLHQKMSVEATNGLGKWPRVVMQRLVS
ncbi:GNAT family N-acetyltransferase [Cryobacterium sp. CG_9.6]|uniref:GNAT family N-acetyltransferase n=1 Tax=Cryobacterium sp. CG_9.6 TaxID=2760710 RepID=UPI00247728F0|nr:GNAT family N-acetyltransferase [Cryobacterium sp. CG_9.6]MDH6238379.1 ribosomal protein S18 acetylase RimI-like enzyme [Cryobacterium sp. CG_9.6]